jgi:peroxiredoxin
MQFRRRLLILPVAAAAIISLCAYKLTMDYKAPATVLLPPAEKRPVAGELLFELYDHHSPQRLVRLAAYLGRHAILVVFFDGTPPGSPPARGGTIGGADRDPVLARLRAVHRQIEAAGAIVLAVSTALPQENRKVIEQTGEFPFPLLSDPGLEVHRAWGRVDAKTGRPLSGVFLIDRGGRVGWEGDHPQPLDDPLAVIDQLVQNR